MPAAPDQPLLTPSQRSVVAYAITLLAALGSFALLIGAFILLGRLVGFFSSVIWPLALAAVLALVLRPVVVLFEKRLKLRRLSSVLVLYGLFTLAVGGILVAVLPPLIEQLIAFITSLPDLWEKAVTYLREHYPQWIALVQKQLANPMVKQALDTFSNEAKSVMPHALPSLKAAGGGILGIFAFFTHLAIVPVYLFFFLLARGEPLGKIGHNLTFLKPSVREDVVFLIKEFVAIIETFFRGQLLIGLILGVLLALGFTIVGLKFGLLIGLVLGLLNIVPYLGTIIGLITVLPLAFFQDPGGGWKLVGLVLLVKAIVQTIESWVVTPKIMGERTGLHPVMIIVAIFFWGTAFGGVLGMLLAIPLTAFFVTVWRLAKQKYFTRAHG